MSHGSSGSISKYQYMVECVGLVIMPVLSTGGLSIHGDSVDDGVDVGVVDESCSEIGVIDDCRGNDSS